jgi:hypothetical protein
MLMKPRLCPIPKSRDHRLESHHGHLFVMVRSSCFFRMWVITLGPWCFFKIWSVQPSIYPKLNSLGHNRNKYQKSVNINIPHWFMARRGSEIYNPGTMALALRIFMCCSSFMLNTSLVLCRGKQHFSFGKACPYWLIHLNVDYKFPFFKVDICSNFIYLFIYLFTYLFVVILKIEPKASHVLILKIKSHVLFSALHLHECHSRGIKS